MNIDWDNAPEGAEAAHPGNDACYPAWYKRDAAGLVEQICHQANVHNWSWMGGRRDFPYGSVLRPSSENKAWTGEGLPPVGTVCAVLNSDLGSPMWERCTILYSGKHRVVYDSESCEERVAFIEELKFRQARTVRTPEQIAEEERAAAIKEMVEACHYSGSECTKTDCAALYDAGYRKQVSE